MKKFKGALDFKPSQFLIDHLYYGPSQPLDIHITDYDVGQTCWYNTRKQHFCPKTMVVNNPSHRHRFSSDGSTREEIIYFWKTPNHPVQFAQNLFLPNFELQDSYPGNSAFILTRGKSPTTHHLTINWLRSLSRRLWVFDNGRKTFLRRGHFPSEEVSHPSGEWMPLIWQCFHFFTISTEV